MEALWIGIAALLGLVYLQIGQYIYMLEQRRFHRNRRRAPVRRDYTPKARLIVPCKGLDLELEANLRALFELDYPRLELCFVVETSEEPAVQLIQRLESQFSNVACRIVYAGRAVYSGQKVHNLIAATREIPADIEVLAFADSDARPQPEWLLRLVERLENGKRAVATGYRWMRPMQATWPNELISAINNTIIGLAGPHRYNLVWGGAWAIRVETFHKLGLPGQWEGTLSDDLTVARLVHKAGLKVGYEPHSLNNSPVDFTPESFAEFLRRQHLVVRVYTPLWWHCGFWLGALINGTLWGSVVLAAVWLVRGGAWLAPATAAVAVYSLTALKNLLTVRVFRPFARVSDEEFWRVARWNVWGWPIVSLANWLGVVAALTGRTIVWRGITYRLVSASKTEVLHPEVTTHSRSTVRTTTKAA